MFKIKNKSNDVRKFRDRFLGKDIFVEPGKSVLTKKRPEENEFWDIEEVSENKKTIKSNKEVNNGSNSNG